MDQEADEPRGGRRARPPLPWRRPAAGAAEGRRPGFRPGLLGLAAITGATALVATVVLQGVFGNVRTGEPDGPAASGPLPEVTVGPPSGEARIMIVGDSLSQGSNGDFTWRYRLWQHLRSEPVDVPVDLVGSRADVFDHVGQRLGADAYADPEFDTDHASRWGASAAALADEVAAEVAESEPDYLLVLAGLNDIVHGATGAQTLDHVADLVAGARVPGGPLRVVLGELLPIGGTPMDERVNAEVAAFNQGLPALAAELTGADSPVVVARTAEGYAPATDAWDGVHPNARGEVRIAAAFADALASGTLGLGEPYPRPLPEVPLGIPWAPTVTAEAREGGAELRWREVTGATGYQVWQRRVAPNPEEFARVPDEAVSGTTARITGLLDGADYEFAVAPLKGNTPGARSEPVAVRPVPPELPAPENLRYTAGTGELSWSAVPAATHYGVWRRPLDTEGDCPPPEEPDSCWQPVSIVRDAVSVRLGPADAGHEFAVRAHADYHAGAVSEPVAVEAEPEPDASE
ncbi:GDSL-type esterase/lipase family protein [Allonocardiopsis opalescens]|uniref:GDSL-like lipase/acylhydrolase family protein n=1 Tax=Allonocardiopsis opalescens TaxID=1144618 RepID=A0A2T0QCD3_9ACTN|nr:SGNH/GDSL hydrolase family protein [Allonocardiopsis opalescens]PRY01577.1 GDSL-like lipase/acylhydrolase family protein [Allonocardiopsis opalescens]